MSYPTYVIFSFKDGNIHSVHSIVSNYDEATEFVSKLNVSIARCTLRESVKFRVWFRNMMSWLDDKSKWKTNIYKSALKEWFDAEQLAKLDEFLNSRNLEELNWMLRFMDLEPPCRYGWRKAENAPHYQ